jgi:exopolyphosphatase / guanosine-5'-triphosphate,3'-diphosphate pyrophosphatase
VNAEIFSPLAAIDVGSNTIHLVVALPTPNGYDLRYLADELDLTRLGEDVSMSGSIGEERQARAIAVIHQQAELARQKGAAAILGIATEGVRAATNAREFLERVRLKTGVSLALISGDQEAALTYWGAISGLPVSDERRAVVDLGGGSLEMVIGAASEILWRISLPLGSGALRNLYAPADPPVASELAAVRAVVVEMLRPLDVPLPVSSALVCGGTANTLVSLAARALHASPKSGAAKSSEASGDEEEASQRELSRERLEALIRLLQRSSSSEISTRYGVDVARVRLLGVGATVLLGALDRLGVEVLRVSRRGIREGALLAYLHTGDRWLEVAKDGVGW